MAAGLQALRGDVELYSLDGDRVAL